MSDYLFEYVTYVQYIDGILPINHRNRNKIVVEILKEKVAADLESVREHNGHVHILHSESLSIYLHIKCGKLSNYDITSQGYKIILVGLENEEVDEYQINPSKFY